MTLYNAETHSLADGIQRTINAGILLTTTVPSPLMAALMDGREKAVVIHYFGDPFAEQPDFDIQRHDGYTTVLFPGDGGYQLPPSHDPDDSATDIRSGIPLWLVKPGADEALVLGYGKLHLRWNSATVALYDPSDRRFLIQMYCGDPRIDIHNAPADWTNLGQQIEEIDAAGGACEPPYLLAPRFPCFRFQDNRASLG